MIKVIDCLYLTKDGCSVKNRTFSTVHLRQGDMDGACSIYSLMMYLLILKTVRRNQIEDIYDKIKKSSEVEKLFHEFFDKHGLMRGGLYFKDLKKMINRAFGDVVAAENYEIGKNEITEDEIVKQIQEVIDTDNPIMLGIDYKGGGGHAVLAVGYEKDDEGLYHIFCLDPGFVCNPTAYWNMVIALDVKSGIYKHQCLTENPYYCPAISITDTLIITKIKK